MLVKKNKEWRKEGKMAYSQVSYGSKGSSVKALQEALNKKGYGLTVDGIFGANTQSAVKSYQKKSGLTVDGIAGKNTWGSLLGSGGSSSTPTASKTSASSSSKSGLSGVSSKTQASLDKYAAGYKPSDTVKKAESYLNEVNGQKPGEFNSEYKDKLNAIYDKIMNRKDFQYDLSNDTLYQQMRDQYQVLGKTAMQDTMGQAAGLTGGYGSTYSQNVGQQAYNNYLQQLNNNIPELYQLALQRYEAEGDKMLEQYQLTGDLYDDEYNKYQDLYNKWLSERDYAGNRYDSERNFDYTDYSNMLSYWQNQAQAENSNYWNEQDLAFSREQFEYQKQQDAIANALARQKAYSGGGGGGKDDEPLTEAQKKNANAGLMKTLLAQAKLRASTGTSNAALTSLLQTYVDKGYIREDQAETIYEEAIKSRKKKTKVDAPTKTKGK